MHYLENKKIKALIDEAPLYQKTDLTGLRRMLFATYVSHEGKIRVESAAILPGFVIARNPGVIGIVNGAEVYNEWPITDEVAIKNYGKKVIDSLTDKISWHKKIATVKAIKLTPEILKELGVDGDTLQITVSWSPNPMLAMVGDYLTSESYSISAYDINKRYELVVASNVSKLK